MNSVNSVSFYNGDCMTSRLTMDGEKRKPWRTIFNPGFSTAAMANSVAHLVYSLFVFRTKLFKSIGKGTIFLDDLATTLTMDVILKVP